MELAYLLLSPLLTLVYSAMPLIMHNYGLAGPWCWIRALDENCEMLVSGFLNQMFNGYVLFLANGVIGIILTISVAVVYCRLSLTVRESRLLLKRTLFVMMFFFAFSLIQAFGLSNRIVTANLTHHDNFGIWLIIGLLYPLSLLLFPLSFLFSFYPVSKLLRATPCIKSGRKNRSSERRNKVHFQSRQTNVTRNRPTFQDSSRVSLPSETFFHVPYTNGFTHITTENALLIHKEDEVVADRGDLTLKEGTDTGYGSTSHQQGSEML